MAETKRNALRRQTDFKMILAHGQYGITTELTTILPNQYIIFVSRTSRYLPQHVIDRRFKEIFTSLTLIKDLIKGTLTNVPPYLKDLETRTYGPGDQCPDLMMQMRDPAWPGMGVHQLPLSWPNQLRILPGEANGQTYKISQYHGTGVTFIVACRGVEGQNSSYSGVVNRYIFPPGSIYSRLQTQDEISARILKRRRNNANLRKNKDERVAKRRR